MVCSDTDSGIAHSEWLLESVITVPSNEVLQQEFRVCEVGSIVLEGLSVGSHESFLEIGSKPNPLLHVFTAEEVLSLLDELVCAHLHVLVEQVAAEHLLAVTVVEHVGGHEQKAESALGHELHVLVVEEYVVVIQEQELYHTQINYRGFAYSRDGGKDHVLFVVWVVDVEVSHVIIPFSYIHSLNIVLFITIVGVQEHGVKWELGSDSLADIKEIEHLFN